MKERFKKTGLVIVTFLVISFLMAQTISLPTFYGIESIKLNDFENGELKMDVNLQIQNSNWFSFIGKDIHLNIHYNNRIISSGAHKESFRFNKKELTLFNLQADCYLDSFKNDLKSILTKDSIQIRVELEGLFSFLKIKTKKSITIWMKTKELIDVMVRQSMSDDGLVVKNVTLKKISLSSTQLMLEFQLKNKFPFDIVLKEMKLDIYSDELKKEKVSEMRVNVEKRICENCSEIITSEVNVNNFTSALSGLSKILKGGSFDYHLSGIVTVILEGREIEIPLKQHFRVNPLTKEIVLLDDTIKK